MDASYEGDLMAKAGVSYVVGRESRDTYNESLAGQGNLCVFDISPYIDPEDSASGLLPMIDKEPFAEGAASRHIITYNFRLQWLGNSAGSPIGAPSHYDAARYELVRRALDMNPSLISWPHANYARKNMISGGIPGRQSDYPEADWSERSRIWREWVNHVKIVHVLTQSHDTLNQGEYPESDDFPNQLYVRMARRMIGPYVMTQHDLEYKTEIADTIGLGYYKVDIYPCHLIATPEGKVASEGETFVMVSPGPYRISYRSLTPKKSECGNLLVPVCILASHVALSSIRMEPTYMVMGEAAGVAAAQALAEKTGVQDIDIEALQRELIKAGCVLEWNGKGYGAGKKVGMLDPRLEVQISGRRHADWIRELYGSYDIDGNLRISRAEWNQGKKGCKWLFPVIDTDKDGQITPKEYGAFQDYKARNPDWQKQRPMQDRFRRNQG